MDVPAAGAWRLIHIVDEIDEDNEGGRRSTMSLARIVSSAQLMGFRFWQRCDNRCVAVFCFEQSSMRDVVSPVIPQS